jgi:hypothetical protein
MKKLINVAASAERAMYQIEKLVEREVEQCFGKGSPATSAHLRRDLYRAIAAACEGVAAVAAEVNTETELDSIQNLLDETLKTLIQLTDGEFMGQARMWKDWCVTTERQFGLNRPDDEEAWRSFERCRQVIYSRVALLGA